MWRTTVAAAGLNTLAWQCTCVYEYIIIYNIMLKYYTGVYKSLRKTWIFSVFFFFNPRRYYTSYRIAYNIYGGARDLCKSYELVFFFIITYSCRSGDEPCRAEPLVITHNIILRITRIYMRTYIYNITG